MKKLLPFFVFLILAGLAYLFFRPTKPSPDMHRAKPDLAVTAAELFADFESDEAAANEKYLNKTVVVQGEIGAINEGPNGMPRLKLVINNTSFGVQCLLDAESTHRRREFHKGELVTMKCICMGHHLDVELTNCVEKR